jgi:predicted nucleic acid-binding protein
VDLYAAATLDNGLGNHSAARDACNCALEFDDVVVSGYVLAGLWRPRRARRDDRLPADTLERLSKRMTASGNDSASSCSVCRRPRRASSYR